MFNEELENKIIALGGSKFESLVRDIIEREFGEKEGFSISHLGKVIGKDTSRQGTPDISFEFKDSRNRENLYFVEITTKRENIATAGGKIITDLNKCKALIQDCGLDVKNIIYACTSEISQDKVSEFHTYCKSFSGGFKFWGMATIVDKLKKYEDLAVKYLSVSTTSGNIKLLSKYPLKNVFGVTEETPFKYRDENKKQIIKALKEKNIVLLTGPSGCGKTRLAIEIARKISGKKSCKAYWAIDCSSNINNDIVGLASKNKESVIIVDDVNRKPASIEALRFIEQYKNIYVILTVRDYALESFKEQAHDIKHEIIRINPLDNKQIANVVQEAFNINNPKYLDYIVDVAKGNLRFAIMTAEVLTQRGNSVSSIPEVLEIYYKSVVKSIDFDGNFALASTLVAISFLKTFDIRDRALLKKICEVFRIQQSDFFGYIDDLNEVELIRLFHDKHRVEIADQILADHLCFRLIISQKKVALTDIFNSFYSDYKNRFLDMLQSLFNIYGKNEELMSEIQGIKEIFTKEGKIVEFYTIFIKLFPTEGIDYCYKKLREYDGSIAYSKYYYDAYGTMLNLLTSQFEEVDNVGDYIIDLLKVKQKQRNAILACFEKNLTLTMKSFENKFKAQIAFITKCLQFAESDPEYFEVLNTLVKIYFPLSFECQEMRHNRYTNKDELAFYRLAYPVDCEARKLRRLVWEGLGLLYKNGYMDRLSKTIEANCYTAIDRELLETDKTFAVDLFAGLPKTTLPEQIFCIKLLIPYRDLEGVSECFDKIESSLGIILYKKYICPIIGEMAFKESQIDDFLEILSHYEDDEIEKNIIALLLACDNNELWTVRDFIPYAFNLLYERDKNGYDKRVIHFLEKAGDCLCHPMAILKNVVDKEMLLQWLNGCTLASKYTWLAQIYLSMSRPEITTSIAEAAFDFFANEYERSVWSNERLMNLQEFEVAKPGFCHDLLNIYLRDKDICNFISSLFYGFIDLDKLLSLLQDDVPLIADAYFYILKHEGHIDFDRKIANFLIQNNSDNLLKLIELKFNTHNAYIKLSDYYSAPEFMELFFECLHNTPYVCNNFHIVEEIKNFDDEVFGKFVRTVIDKYISDKVFLNEIAIITCSFDSDRQILFLDELLKAKVDESILSNLHVLGYPNSWSGSLVPQIQNKIDALSDYIKQYNRSPHYLPFLHQLLDKLCKWKTDEEIREYNNP